MEKVVSIILIMLLVVMTNTARVIAQEEVASVQQGPDKQLMDLGFSIDYSRFRYADSLTYLEFSISLFQNMLQYTETENNRFQGQFLVTAELKQQDSVLTRTKWINENHVNAISDISPTQRLFTIKNFSVSQGEYDLAITVKDMNREGDGSESSMTVPVEIEKFGRSSLQISDVQLASLIERDGSQNPFVKNGFRIMPNPTYLYGVGLPMLYFYAEIYNLTPSESDSGKNYIVNYIISDRDNKEVKRYENQRVKPGLSAVEVNKINVVTMVSGPYTLTIEVKDCETDDVVRTRHKFYVYRQDDFNEDGELIAQVNKGRGEGSPGLDAHRYDVMPEEDLDQEFDYAKYIATKEELETYENLNLEGKRNFIKSFWANRDNTPGTPENEYKKDYLARVKTTNKEFQGGFKDGWKTDRGRVMLVYGVPNEIERNAFESQAKPYQVWSYHAIQGGVIFIFVDRRGLGEYDLVHSTAFGELRDDHWQRWLSPDAESSTSGYNNY